MKLGQSVGAANIYAALAAAHALDQSPLTLLTSSERRPTDIAIIGAGASGSSAAYHLSLFASGADVPVNVTVFERNSYVGGRSTTINAYDDPNYPVELGASIFVEVNHILVNASRKFNLTTQSFGSSAHSQAPSLGIWDGNKFVLTLAAEGPTWWDTAKLLFRYGLSPIRTRSLMKSTVGKFLTMYDEPVFPFASLTDAAADVDLLGATSTCGDRYLFHSGISAAFAHDVVQASSRVNYAQNLGSFHGLETMVCMATDGAMAVDGGNWQIFDHMISSSGAHLLLNTSVIDITGSSNGGYIVGSHTDSAAQSTASSSRFDAVILATPIDFANLKIDAGMVAMPSKNDYVKLHVTLFTSPRLPDPGPFGLTDEQSVPLTILTTTECARSPESCFRHDTPGPWFYSISILAALENPTTGNTEYLYKIFSHEEVSDEKLSAFFKADPTAGTSSTYVTWLHRKEWLSYPYEYPRSRFEDIELGSNLWYTGGMDTFISTMETNALMGKNVAKLVLDKLNNMNRHDLSRQAILAEAL